MSWCCCCLFPDVVPSLKAGGDPIPWAHPGLCWRCHGAGSGLAQPQTLGSSNHWGPSHFQPPAALVKRKNGNNGHGPMGGMMIVFSWKKKKKETGGKERQMPSSDWSSTPVPGHLSHGPAVPGWEGFCWCAWCKPDTNEQGTGLSNHPSILKRFLQSSSVTV